MLLSMGSQRVGHDLVIEQQQQNRQKRSFQVQCMLGRNLRKIKIMRRVGSPDREDDPEG